MQSVQPLLPITRLARFVASAAISFVLTGCLATVPVTHRSNIGLTKETLQPLIGSDEGTVVQETEQEPTYRLDDGPSTYLVYAGSYEEDAITVMFTPWPVPLPIPLEKYGGTDCLLLEFDDGQFKRYEFAVLDYSVGSDCREAFWMKDEIQKILRPSAQGGDARAQFEYYWLAPEAEAFTWLCLAANNGHQQARSELAYSYRIGIKPVSKDPVAAYVWYGLASTSNTELNQSRVALDMTPDQIAEAERLIADWKSNPADCEAFRAQAGN